VSSLKAKRVTPHVLRHTTAMDLLQAGVDRSLIALWLGHESVETTQIYFEANLAMKEQALARTAPLNGRPGRYRPATNSWDSWTRYNGQDYAERWRGYVAFSARRLVNRLGTEAARNSQDLGIVAEREGFEPSVEFPLHTLSKRAPSATRSSLREKQNQQSSPIRQAGPPPTRNVSAACPGALPQG